MNGPLLVSLLPPERLWEAAGAAPDQVSYVVAFLLLAGILLSLWTHPPGRWWCARRDAWGHLPVPTGKNRLSARGLQPVLFRDPHRA